MKKHSFVWVSINQSKNHDFYALLVIKKYKLSLKIIIWHTGQRDLYVKNCISVWHFLSAYFENKNNFINQM